jgi:hypothetical protein
MFDLATYLCQGSYLESSKDTIRRAPKLSNEHPGKKDRATISTMSIGQSIHHMLGDWKAARVLASQPFSLCKLLKGFDHEDTPFVMAEACWTYQYGDDAPVVRNHMEPFSQHSEGSDGSYHLLTMARIRELHNHMLTRLLQDAKEEPNPVTALVNTSVWFC